MAWILTVVAYISSTISGTIGMAGGALLIGMMAVVGLPMAVAVPVHGAVQAISNGTRAYAHLEHVHWRLFLWHAIPMLPMPFIGLSAVHAVDGAMAKTILAVVIVYAVWAPKWGVQRLPDKLAFALAGIIAGFFGVIIGASGPIIAPFFLRPTFNRKSLVATKAICQLFNHLLKIVAFSTASFEFFQYMHLILPMGLAVVAGTYTGKWLLHRIDEQRFVLLYRVVLTLLAMRLGYDGISHLMRL